VSGGADSAAIGGWSGDLEGTGSDTIVSTCGGAFRHRPFTYTVYGIDTSLISLVDWDTRRSTDAIIYIN